MDKTTFTNEQLDEQQVQDNLDQAMESSQDHDFDMNMERVEGEDKPVDHDLTMTVDDECNMENEALNFEGCFGGEN